ncbi:MAG: hypothetical protein ACRCYO_10060 [Bacteroidia bacterium]
MLQNKIIMIGATTSLTSIGFILLVCITFIFLAFIFAQARKRVAFKSTLFLIGIASWIGLQTILALNHFYSSNLDSTPPRFFLAVLPIFLAIAILFNTRKGKQIIDAIPVEPLYWFHTIRIPVELILYGLFLQKYVPELMTFAGRNFDIVAGITAPLVAYLGIRKKKFSKPLLLIWNFGCIALLLNIVVYAILSAPFPFQQLALDQPNVAVLYFPMIFLPALVVPAVVFAHFVSIRRLLQEK